MCRKRKRSRGGAHTPAIDFGSLCFRKEKAGERRRRKRGRGGGRKSLFVIWEEEWQKVAVTAVAAEQECVSRQPC